jgi:hypothetical protein
VACCPWSNLSFPRRPMFKAPSKTPLSAGPVMIAAWGIVGVLGVLTQACIRLAPQAWQPIAEDSFLWWHWIIWGAWVGQMLYSEGYRGFHCGFSPRVIARALYLARHPRPLRLVLAPLFCMGFFHATRRRLVVAWSVTAGVVALVVLVSQVAQPWRGLIDAGVVCGLVAGALSIVYFAVVACGGGALPVPADVPEAE